MKRFLLAAAIGALVGITAGCGRTPPSDQALRKSGPTGTSGT